MRVAGWPQLLATKVEEWRPRTFAWGTADCFQFVADVVFALTGTDYRQQFGEYASEAEALKIIAEAGGAEAMLTRCLGEPKPVAKAGRGDLVGLPAEHGFSPAICLGVKCCVVTPDGMFFENTRSGVMAWTV